MKAEIANLVDSRNDGPNFQISCKILQILAKTNSVPVSAF